jgi:hypothetical protein
MSETTTTTAVLAWHGDPELRERIVARMRQHHAADTIRQDVFQMLDPDTPLGYRGCAIGCLLDPQPVHPGLIQTVLDPPDGWHMAVERQFGIPHRLALVIDDTFVDQRRSHAPDFALAVAEAIPVGADLSGVADAFHDAFSDVAVESPMDAARILVALIAAAPVAG